VHEAALPFVAPETAALRALRGRRAGSVMRMRAAPSACCAHGGYALPNAGLSLRVGYSGVPAASRTSAWSRVGALTEFRRLRGAGLLAAAMTVVVRQIPPAGCAAGNLAAFGRSGRVRAHAERRCDARSVRSHAPSALSACARCAAPFVALGAAALRAPSAAPVAVRAAPCACAQRKVACAQRAERLRTMRCAVRRSRGGCAPCAERCAGRSPDCAMRMRAA
jgi:hypothetical protein